MHDMIMSDKVKINANRFLLIIILGLQSLYLILEIKKDVYICYENCSEYQISERMNISNIQGKVSSLLLLVLLILVIVIILNFKKDIVKKIMIADLKGILVTVLITLVVCLLFRLHVGNALENVMLLSLVIVILSISYLKVRHRNEN